MNTVIDFPGLRTVSVLNSREHWTRRHKRAAAHRLEAKVRVFPVWAWLRDNWGGPVERLRVTFRRFGGRAMDDDNLRAAFKALRDGVAEVVGRDDGDTGFWDWRYEQAPGAFGARVTIEVLPISKETP